jgi:type II secretory pathway pseudopilin PulG
MDQMVKNHQKRSGLVCGMKNNRAGFALVELLVAFAIMGILMQYLVPNLRGSNPRYERQQFVARFNALTQLAWQRAITTNKIQKISVDLSARSISLSESTGVASVKDEVVFAPVRGQYIRTTAPIPPSIDIKQFVIEGFDEMGRFAGGRKTTEAYFYVIPSGLAQEVTITFADKNDLDGKRPRTFELALNPFNAQFTVIE